MGCVSTASKMQQGRFRTVLMDDYVLCWTRQSCLMSNEGSFFLLRLDVAYQENIASGAGLLTVRISQCQRLVAVLIWFDFCVLRWTLHVSAYKMDDDWWRLIAQKCEEHDAATSIWNSIEADANKDKTTIVLEYRVKEKIVERTLQRRKCVVFAFFEQSEIGLPDLTLQNLSWWRHLEGGGVGVRDPMTTDDEGEGCQKWPKTWWLNIGRPQRLTPTLQSSHLALVLTSETRTAEA